MEKTTPQVTQLFHQGDHVTLFEQHPDSKITNNPVMIVLDVWPGDKHCIVNCGWFNSRNEFHTKIFEQSFLNAASSRK
jgi:hypothetical protein